ncbi:MAG: hypothetical protein IT288_05645 [Bdellovibrionales bacterium]|nr:hypothetical protein [Bdellovibrionales bacterium]
MANSLDQTKKDSIRQAYLDTGSIKEVARKTGCSRNTVKKLLRAEGLTLVKPSVPECAPEIKDRPMTTLDFTFLERLFEMNKESGENADFEKHIKKVINELAAELNVAGRTDMLRLEAAIFQFIVSDFTNLTTWISPHLTTRRGGWRTEGTHVSFHHPRRQSIVSWRPAYLAP